MIMKKKPIAILLVLLLTCSLFAGCGSKKPADADRTDPVQTAQNDTDNGGADNVDATTGEQPASTTQAQAQMVQLAAPLGEGSSPASAPGAGEVQDVSFYAGGRLGGKELSTGDDYYVRNIEGTASDLEVYLGYISYLQQNGFTVVGDYHKDYEQSFLYNAASYYATTLDDTRSAINKRFDLQFSDAKNPGNICCYCKIERDKLTGQVWYPRELDVKDFGARFEGGNADMSYAGASATAGLYGDGTHFETSDGRLKTDLGSAMVIRDGSTYTVPVDTTRDEDLEVINYFVRNYYRTDSIALRYLENYLMQGDVLTHYELKATNAFQDYMEGISTIDDAVNWKWQTALIFSRDNRYSTVTEDQTGGITKAFVRALVYEKGKLAVFYIAAEFSTSPKTVEALCAFDLTKTTSIHNNGGTGTGTGTGTGSGGVICSNCGGDGKVTCGTCNGTGHIERYAAGGGTITSGCTTCNGSKEVTCPICHGEGRLH